MDEAVEKKIAALRARYAQGMLSQADALAAAIAAWNRSPADEELAAEARRLAHKLGGTSGTYGFAEVSASAREIQRLFTGPPPSPDAVGGELAKVLAAARLAARTS